MDYTEIEIIKNFLESHWQDVLDLYASKMQDASTVEKVPFDEDKHIGVLVNYVWEGVHKVVQVTPESLVEGLSQLGAEIRRRCIEAAEAAEDAADYANEKGDYAKTQGDRVVQLIASINDLRARLESAEALRVGNEQDRQDQELVRQQQETVRQRQEASRQQEFEENEDQRQLDFELAETERMRIMLVTRFYIDPDTQDLHVRQVANDDISYRIDNNGDLIASFSIESV